MRENRYNDVNFAAAVQAELDAAGSDVTVRPRAVRHWREGTTVPRSKTLQAILKVGNGGLTADMFHEAKAASA